MILVSTQVRCSRGWYALKCTMLPMYRSRQSILQVTESGRQSMFNAVKNGFKTEQYSQSPGALGKGKGLLSNAVKFCPIAANTYLTGSKRKILLQSGNKPDPSEFSQPKLQKMDKEDLGLSALFDETFDKSAFVRQDHARASRGKFQGRGSKRKGTNRSKTRDKTAFRKVGNSGIPYDPIRWSERKMCKLDDCIDKECQMENAGFVMNIESDQKISSSDKHPSGTRKRASLCGNQGRNASEISAFAHHQGLSSSKGAKNVKDFNQSNGLITDKVSNSAKKKQSSSAIKPTDSSAKLQSRQHNSGSSHKAKRPNFFLALRIRNPAIINKVKEAQQSMVETNSILRHFIVHAETLHITLLVLKLGNADEVQYAIETLANCKSEIVLAGKSIVTKEVQLDGLSHFSGQVVFVQPKLDEVHNYIMKLSSILRENFRKHGVDIVDESKEKFHPHATIMKLSKNFKLMKKVKKIPVSSFTPYRTFHFGTELLTEVLLCSMVDKKDHEGFYQVYSSLQLDDNSTSFNTSVPQTVQFLVDSSAEYSADAGCSSQDKLKDWDVISRTEIDEARVNSGSCVLVSRSSTQNKCCAIM